MHCSMTIQDMKSFMINFDGSSLVQALGVLQLEYVTVASVQKQIGSEMSFSMAKKMVDMMIDDGYIERTASNRRMGEYELICFCLWTLGKNKS